MNVGLLTAKHDHVLFLDDDIRPAKGLVAAHDAAHAHANLVAGRILQPWDEGRDVGNEGAFAGLRAELLHEFMGGNFSVHKETALKLGGFDENFVKVAYRFEAAFAHRWRAAGEHIWFAPSACIHHLKVQAGGTRTYGEHLTTSKPDHAVGAYEHALRTRTPSTIVTRALRAIATKHHLRHPLSIPRTIVAEARGLAWAVALAARGPKYVDR